MCCVGSAEETMLTWFWHFFRFSSRWKGKNHDFFRQDFTLRCQQPHNIWECSEPCESWTLISPFSFFKLLPTPFSALSFLFPSSSCEKALPHRRLSCRASTGRGIWALVTQLSDGDPSGRCFREERDAVHQAQFTKPNSQGERHKANITRRNSLDATLEAQFTKPNLQDESHKVKVTRWKTQGESNKARNS